MRLPAAALAVVALLGSPLARADEAFALNHQGRLLDQGDRPVSGAKSLTFRLYSRVDGVSADVVWSETYDLQLNADGLYAVELGAAQEGKKAITAQHLAGNRWLAVVVDGAELQPRLRVGAVGRALVADHAKTADDAAKLGGVDAAGFLQKGESAADAAKLGGKAAAEYLLKTDAAADAAKLGGKDAAEYLLASAAAADSAKLGGKLAAEYLLATGTAANAAKLGGVDAASFLQKSETAADSAKLGGRLPEEYVLQGGAPAIGSTRPATPAAGTLTYNAQKGLLEVYDGAGWAAVMRHPRSCNEIKASGYDRGDGLYWIQPATLGQPVKVYCDMTTQGGGWTLVSYGYRAQSGGTAVYLLPNQFASSWDAGGRGNTSAIDATELVRLSRQAALGITTGGAPVTGNLLAYNQAYVYAIPSPDTTVFNLNDPPSSSCSTVSVSELKAASTFNAYVLTNKLQVSCSGNKAGTPYERQFIGFNSSLCYGVCGADPVTSNGMEVWYGSGYNPTTSAGSGNAERAGSFSFWLK